MKKTLAFVLFCAMLITCLSPVYSVYALEDTALEPIDVILVAYMYLASVSHGETLWLENPEVECLVPLYNQQGEHIAWYILLTSGSYAVINNNKNNPCAIEFGSGGNALIDEILKNDEYAHIVYCNPVNVLNSTTMNERIVSPAFVADYYSTYPQTKEKNEIAAGLLDEAKRALANVAVVANDDGDYGFIPYAQMPTFSGRGYSLDTEGMGQWAIMSDYDDIASNHCAATCATNLTLYFACKGYNVKHNNNKRETFIRIHNLVGDGPVYSFYPALGLYFASKGYTLRTTIGVNTFEDVQTAINQEKPCSLLLCNSLLSWHQVLCYGWFISTAGNEYMKIMNGWDHNINFYMADQGSTWIDGCSYYVE